MPTRPKAVEGLVPRHAGRDGQFETPAQDKRAARIGMWVFLASELMFFGAAIGAFLIYRLFYPRPFMAAAGHLDRVLGTLNTSLLLVTSGLMTLARRLFEGKRPRAAAFFLALTAALGCAFLAIKWREYVHEAGEGLIPFAGWTFVFDGPDPDRARLFFTEYFFLTGLHALHLAIGVVFAAGFAIRCALPPFDSPSPTSVELGTLYWHFVDGVWIFLFPILYLAR